MLKFISRFLDVDLGDDITIRVVLKIFGGVVGSVSFVFLFLSFVFMSPAVTWGSLRAFVPAVIVFVLSLIEIEDANS